MKKVFTTLFLVVAMMAANAQITRGTIGMGNYTDYSGATNNVYGLDFNNDGTNEFAIQTGYDGMTGEPVENGSIVFNWEENGTNVATDAEMWDYFNLFTVGSTISSSTSFSSYGDCYFSDYTPSSTPLYLGFRLKLGSNIHYGYAKVTITAEGVNWQEIYYNATPNAPITIGSTQAISQATNARFDICTLGNRQIRFCQDAATQVVISDMMGRQVSNICADQATITLPAVGIYVVSTPTARRTIVVR